MFSPIGFWGITAIITHINSTGKEMAFSAYWSRRERFPEKKDGGEYPFPPILFFGITATLIELPNKKDLEQT